MVLLAILAAVFSPKPPPAPSADQRWDYRAGPVLVTLATDMTAAKNAMSSETGLRSSLSARLQSDLNRLRGVAPPRGSEVRRIWTALLQAGDAAVASMGDFRSPDGPARAGSDLDLASQLVVALAQSAGSEQPLYPH